MLLLISLIRCDFFVPETSGIFYVVKKEDHVMLAVYHYFLIIPDDKISVMLMTLVCPVFYRNDTALF